VVILEAQCQSGFFYLVCKGPVIYQKHSETNALDQILANPDLLNWLVDMDADPINGNLFRLLLLPTSSHRESHTKTQRNG
jgi:hypothetical protein